MNCREFENNIDSLARGALTDSRVREEAAAHETSCATCAARLAEERALTSALRALASSMKEAEAPTRVEVALLASFRANAASVGVAEVESEAVRASSVLALPERVNVKGWSWMKTLAVASLAAAAAVALFVFAPQFAHAPSNKTSNVAQTQSETGTRNNSTQGANADATSTSDAGQLARSSDDAGTQQSPTIQDVGPAPRMTSPRRPTNSVRASEAALRMNSVGSAMRPGSDMTGDANVAEIATDFIPLMQGGQFGQAEGGRLVRVELPRS